MDTLLGNLEQLAIDRLRFYEKGSLEYSDTGFHLAYSGGKDSDIILHIAKKSGVKFKAHHCLTTCDPPEVVYHVRTHPEVEIIKPELTMWQLVRKKGMPPRRNARYCCEVLKESAGNEGIVITGVRWGESRMRAKRRMFEARKKTKRKWLLHPIIDWTEHDVWTYIKQENIQTCCLYSEGYSRIGCVLCPMKKNKIDIQREMDRWPKIAKAWEKAVKATFKPDSDKRYKFESPEEYWQWWLDRDRRALKDDENQCYFGFYYD